MARNKKPLRGVILEYQGQRHEISTDGELTICQVFSNLQDVTSLHTEIKIRVVGLY